jgi:hypothetical protein
VDTTDLRNAIRDLLAAVEDDAAAVGLYLELHPERLPPSALEDLLAAARDAAGRLGAIRQSLAPEDGAEEAGGGAS